MGKNLKLLSAALALIIVTGCADSGSDSPSGPNNGAGLRAVWRGANGVGQAFSQRCTPCHISQSQGGYNVADYASAMQGGRVVAGDSANSYLVWKLEGRPAAGSQMPQGGPYFSAAEIDSIKVWIQSGAADN